MADTAVRKTLIASCSFCGKPNTDVATLVAGPGVYICDECVTLCQLIMESKPASVPQLRAWPPSWRACRGSDGPPARSRRT